VATGSSQRVNVNQAGTRELSNVLRNSVSQERLGDIVQRARLGRPFENILDFYFRTGMTMEEFGPVADRLTTRRDRSVRGLINVNTAPGKVLLCLPGLEESDVSALMSARSADNADTDSIAWVANALPQAKAVGIGSFITTQSYQFSADIVSVCGNGRAFRRCRIVVDAQQSPPRVIYRQNLTSLGWPLAPEILGQLRSGTPVEQVVGNVYQGVR